jgi:hypothetical protein
VGVVVEELSTTRPNEKSERTKADSSTITAAVRTAASA